MYKMFKYIGKNTLTELDLGPAFTKIPTGNITYDSTTYVAYYEMFGDVGKNGVAVIYAPESIFADENNFKADTNSSTKISYIKGTINPIYKPEFTKISSTLDATNASMTVVVKGDANKDQTAGEAKINYHSDIVNSLTADDITVYVDGEKADSITKQIVSAVSSTNAETGKSEITYTIKFTNLDEGIRQTDETGNIKKFNEWSGNIELQFAKGKLKDEWSNGNLAEYVDKTGETQKIVVKEDETYEQNTTGKMFIDTIIPEFTYEYSETTIDHGTKTVTVIFDVADKYFASSTLSTDATAENITVKLDGEIPENSTKTLTKISDLTATINGVENTKIGERYQLVVTNLDQGEGDNYSGIMTMSFTAGLITDKSGNSNIAKTITIGIDDPTTDDDHDTGVIVDVVDPIWKVENINIDNTNKQVTAELVATDKYLTGVANSTLTTDDITLKVDGDVNANTSITKTLSTPTFSTNTTTGLKEIRYTLTLSNWEQATKQSGKTFLEYSGTAEITIKEGTVRDDATGITGTTTDGNYNTSNEQTFTLGHADFIKPRIEKESSTIDASAKTETIVFNVIDKYLDTTKTITADDIKVYVDGEEATLTKTLTRVTANDVSETVNGTAQTISQQYKLVLSDFEKTRNAKNYKDWSGTVTIEIAENKVQDKEITSDTNTSGGNKNDVTTLDGDFVDFINPDLQYVHQELDIDKTGKKYKMTFTVTDKYYRTGKLTIDDLTIKMQNGQYDANGDPIIYNLKNEPVTIALQDAEINASNVAMTNATTGNVETVSNVLIGHTYTLTISNLEQFEIKTGLTTKDYSGIVTVAVEGNKVLDRGIEGNATGTTGSNIGNGNIATTITSGVNIPGGTSPDDAEVVDVVLPVWTKVSSSANAFDPEDKTTSTATVTFRGTDTYFANSTLTSDNIKVLVDGIEVTSGITKTLSSATALTEQRKDFGTNTSTTKQYGVEYTLTIKGFKQYANQVKIQLPAGTITDEYGNSNIITELTVFNTLVKTSSESQSTSNYMGNASIQRQNVDNVTFMDNIPSTVYNKITGTYVDSTAWDVSAQQDKSILAWYTTNSNGTVKVYIGSDDEIFGNYNSTYLFGYVGYSDNCTSTETITNIELLNVSNVVNTSGMFIYTGYKSMTKLDLKDNFDTSNVIYMTDMLHGTGYTAMTEFNIGSKFDTAKVTTMNNMFAKFGFTKLTNIDLGDKFDTSSVVNMAHMFDQCGKNALTSLDLKDKFDTSNVTNMQGMFLACGVIALTDLDLGDKFNTSKVTDMNNMFYYVGFTKMTSLDLGDKFDTSNVTNMNSMFYRVGGLAMTNFNIGDKFDTSNVTNMNSMFYNFGSSKLTTLDLGDKFYTTKVTDMTKMFYGCGSTAMTTLDLGPAFIKIAETNTDMFTNTGKESSITIYASEQIYLSKNNFKLNTDATTSAIEYTRGTINPKYRTEWVKELSTIDTTNKNITITLRGRTNAEAGVDFTSNVQSTLTTDNIHVYIDGVEVPTTSILTKTLGTATTTANAVTGANDVLQVLTISNIEEALRQTGKSYKEWSGNISLKIDKKTLKDTTYNNQNLQAIDTTGEMIDIEIKDTTVDKNTTGTMFTDYIKPEFTYIYSNGNIDYTNKTLTVEFSVTDKYFESSTILSNKDNIAIKLLDTNVVIPNAKITKELTKTEDIMEDRDGDGTAETKIGEKYKLVIGGLEQQTADGNYIDYSGPMSISIPAGVAVDKSANANNATTITIGVNEPGGNIEDQEIVDVVDPIWKIDDETSTTIDETTGDISVVVDIYGTDKYYKQNTLTADKIQLWVDGINITAEGSTTEVIKTLTKVEDLTETRTIDGVEQQVTYGVHYKLSITGIRESDDSFFAERIKYKTDPATGRLYREFSGTMKIVIPENTIIDNDNNQNLEYEYTLDSFDTLRPEIIQISSESNIDADNVENSTQTIIFDVVDKYMKTSTISETNTSMIHVLIDGQEAESITKPTTAEEQANNNDKIFKEIVSIETLKANIGGDANHIIGYRYTLKLSNFENPRTSAIYGDYTTWSGNLSMKIDANTVTDNNNSGNIETELTGDENSTTKEFVDFIKPDVTYKYSGTSKETTSNPEIDYNGKTYTMVFEITDKNFASSTLTIDNLNITIDGQEPDWYTTGETIDGTKVSKSLTSTEIRKTVNGVANTLIGYRYTLTLSNIEQLQIKSGREYLDYSGVITVAIPAGVAKDKGPKGTDTTGTVTDINKANVNDAVTITSGIDIPGGVIPDDSQIVDVVDPIWQKVSSSANAFDPADKSKSTATIVVKGTDKYYASSNLTADKIKIFVDGTEVTNGSVTVTVDNTVTDINSSSGNKIGDQYTINVKGWNQYAKQVKIQIQPGTITDEAGNTNKATDLIVLNVLQKAAIDASTGKYYDIAETSGFIGNTNIQRQNIENITFESNIPNTVYDPITDTYVDSTAWDVSEMQDKSIIAWYETSNANGALKVHIGSNDEIFANTDSSGLFMRIGVSDICTATEAMTNIELLNTSSAMNMNYMFYKFGFTAMTSLDLGNNFDTSNVLSMNGVFYSTGENNMTTFNLGSNFDTSNAVDMQSMFVRLGYYKLTALDLGNKFDTSKVNNMYQMFSGCGQIAMTTLNLGDKFDTGNVKNMQYMFYGCGRYKLVNFSLGDKFNTSKVTNMSWMFRDFGRVELTTLELGDKFDTSNVINMECMFYRTGATKMTNLNLGNKFDTSKVTNMYRMFYYTGYNSMTGLDLGDKFYTTNVTNMVEMFNGCGNKAMKTLDLGPAFTRIPDGEITYTNAYDEAETNVAYKDMLLDCGGNGTTLTIYVAESIYKDMKNLKLNTDNANVSIPCEENGTTINPIYKPEWSKESSSINAENKTITVKVKAIAGFETQTLNGVTLQYNSKITTTIPEGTLTGENAKLLNIYIDGELDGDTNKNGILDEGETPSITRTIVKDTTRTTDTEIYYSITLSNIEQALRQSGKNFKEWSGNISIQPLKGTLTDVYGNKNMQEIDLTEGTWTKVELKDTAVEKNTNGTMFTDYIKPEFTYEYYNTEIDTDANTVIDYESKTVTVVFDVTDKYFKQANITADNMTIKLDDKEPDWTKSTKTLTKKTLDADKVVGDITYKANGDIYYNINGTPTKIGERYELVVTGLETQNGVGYSGVMTMSFPAGELNADGTVKTGIVDKSGNLSLAKTITIGIDDPENHPEHDEEVIVDVVNPLWTGPHNINTIDRTNETVKVQILGSDRYYATDVFAEAIANGTINTALSKIKVYVDGVEQTSITKTLTKLSETELQTIKTNADLQDAVAEDVKVGYTLTLGNYGDISGETTIVIEPGTITDQSGNSNIQTTIPVGNITWVETNEPLNEGDTGYPRYHAYREDIVDFINPAIKYQYSEIQVDTDGDGVADSSIMANPEIDYEAKTLTVKFTVTDKYLVQSSIMNANGTLNTDNVKIKISTLNNSGVEEFKDITDEGITTTITSAEITDGYEYTLTIKDFEQIYNNKGNYMDYSGIVQLVFAEGQIDDTSGNKNIATTITLDTGTGDDPNSGIVVDVINPIIERTAENLSVNNSSNTINRDTENETGTVTVLIKATDKYLATGTLQSAENVERMKVKVIKPDGTTVMPDTITKTVTQVSKQATSITYRITLGNFETNEGITSIIIPEGVITDTSGNGNLETEILVGNSTWTEAGDSAGEYDAFKNSIVDFTMPKWEYATSSIIRNRDGETGTVTIKILGSDIYYLKDTLTANNISVYVANSENPDEPITTITKNLEKITNTDELEGADTGYYLTLGNFGTYDGQVKIKIAENVMQDTSGNGNKLTEILVGNPNWVETDIEDNAENPKYTAFRNSIVDFIKPTIKYQYTADVNPIVDQENKTFTMTFDVTDTNLLESALTLEDIQIFVDDIDVTGTLTKTLTSADIADENINGIRYTLTLTNFELPDILAGDSYKKHSGKIELVIAEGKVKDTSGNENIETRIIVDNDDGDDANNYVRVDFINPKLYYVDKHISWDNRYATVTIAGTDRFYDFDTKLNPADIKLYQENDAGQYIEVSDLKVSINSVETDYGYNFVIRLDDFEEEYKMKISIPAGKIADLDGHYNEATDIIVGLDNKKPVWKYMSTDTSEFENDGKVSFNVKGYDKFLNLSSSGLEDGDVSVYRDGTDISSTVGITITEQGQDEEEKSKSYKIDVTGLTETGTYSLVFKEKTLIDEFLNESATTTITFSKSIISSNTDNYQKVTYHASSDFELTHQSYVHELMSVNTTGTNAENTTFRPSTIGEIYDDGKNTLFAEPFTYASGTQSAYSFKGWALADEDGFIIDKTTGKPLSTSEGSVFDETKATIYGLYDEIPETAKADDNMVHLKAVWQQAKVIFVSSGSGNNSKDGLSPDTPVKDLQTAYSKLNSSGTASTNIIVIMDEVEWNSSTKLTGNATITSLYAGVDYKTDGAELKISSNLEVDGDIKFDNIKLYSDSTTVSDGSDYLANGTYTNMLITNYGDVTLGRRISTPDGKYTFGAVVGGNYKTEAKTGEIGIHTVIIEAGRYNNIIIGSALNSGGQTTTAKYVSHEVLIGNMKDSASARNDKLTITGYVSMGELEDRCYPYNTSGSQDKNTAYTRTYGITKLYSGTFTGENKFAKVSENASIYLRPINGYTDGATKFEMYGGDITGNVYAGSRMATSGTDSTEKIYQNDMKFYGGKITGNIFGNGANDTSTGDSKIELAGRIEVIGNVFGGSNATTIGQGKVTGNTYIYLQTASAKVDGNIYGGSNGIIDGTSIDLNNGLISKNTYIVINAGTVTGDIFGGGYNCGVTGSVYITINNGTISGSTYGGAYQNQVRTATHINIKGGNVNAIYGGNVLTSQSQQNNDTLRQDTNITIEYNRTIINGPIYGSGKYDKVGTATIELYSCGTTPTIYGGSDGNGATDKVEISIYEGMTVDNIYGGSNGNGTVTTSNIYLYAGTVTDVYGGGYGGTTTTSNIYLNGNNPITRAAGSTGASTTVTNIYGGSNLSGTVGTSNVILKEGSVTNVFGGGNSASVGTANVTLDGITIDTIYGGSKNTGTTTNTNVVLKSGTVTNAYGGGLGSGTTNANVTQQGARVTNIFGGSHDGTGDGGIVTSSTINIDSGNVTNVYGGNDNKGIAIITAVNVRGTSTVNKIYGGGYNSDIGTSASSGSTTINVSGGTIDEIYGGSYDAKVYGTTNINIGADVVTDSEPVAGNITIKGDIYGAGYRNATDYSYTGVYGNTHISLTNSTSTPITFSGNIFGAGKGSNYSTNNTSSDESTVKLMNFGTSSNSYKMTSIQRTGKVYIGNSYLELTGASDKNNYYKTTLFTLNRITKGLAIHDNTTLYTRRGFNMVGGFDSYLTNADGTTTNETVSISGNIVTRNVDNRLYTFEGINLIFAKQEGEIYDRTNEDLWGDVNGMAFFGMYRINRSTSQKEYDIYAPNYSGGAVEEFFANGTYVEGRHKANHDTTVDGFYTNVADYTDSSNITVTPQVIDVTDYGTYYDWIIGADIVNYSVGPLIASTYSTWSTAELKLDYKYQQGATYTLNRISTNAFDTGVDLVNKLNIPTIASDDNANNIFGLTMETDKTGWLQSGTTNMYTDSNGSFDGATVYKSDNSSDPGTLIFKVFNSINVSETKDLGNVNIVLTGKTRTGEDASAGNTFKIVIAVSLQSLYEQQENDGYIPKFTNSIETELNYTTDSSVDISYILYKNANSMNEVYTTGDYRVLSSTVQLPVGTRITLKDYGQGNDVNAVYYYQVPSNTSYDAVETVDGKTRYLYKLSHFKYIGTNISSVGDFSGNGNYADDNSLYYHAGTGTGSTGGSAGSLAGSGYVFEKYDISINLIDSNINTNQLEQETYLQLRSSDGRLKIDNGGKSLIYNLYNNNATKTEIISNEGQSYSVFENLTIPFTFDATLLEKVVGTDGTVGEGTSGASISERIQDTKYYDKKIGLAIEIVDEVGTRVKAPEVQNLRLTDVNDSTISYTAGDDGVIRVPLSDGLAKIQNQYKLTLSQYNVPAGLYTAKIYLFASDDGLHYGNEVTLVKEFNITFINRLLGLAGVESTNDSRIINKTTGLNLEGNTGLDLTVKVGSPTDDTNIRVELYKRNPTYSELSEGVATYTGPQYTKVDLSQYLEGTWETPESQGLITADGCTEYMVMPKETYGSVVELKTVDFKKAIKQDMTTGEYKLIFKAYYDNTLIQTVTKTFIVIQ